MEAPLEKEIKAVCDELASFLIAKNKAYGNSAISPQRIFSKADPVEQLLVRMDDKLSRIANRQDDDEDPFLDLIGYLILHRIAGRDK